jgi:hypothetical protein
MKHQPDVKNKLHNPQNLLSGLESRITVGKQFNLSLHQLQLMKRTIVIIMQEVTAKN